MKTISRLKYLNPLNVKISRGTGQSALRKFIRFFYPCLLFFSCGRGYEKAEVLPVTVQMAAVKKIETSEEVTGFGSLSFLKKFELASPVDGILETLNFREGDRINKDDIVAIIKNPQINLAARRSEDAYSQALSAVDLVLSRLRESEFNIESRLLENEKALEELRQAERLLEEEKRKHQSRETLYEAGGLSDESIREERFRLASAEAEIFLMGKELEIRSIGLRETDLAAAGIPVPHDAAELKKALIFMATAGMRAEVGAARANLEAASREMEAARLMEAELFIRSPGHGIVGARYVETGERIKRDDRIITIMETDLLYAIFPVPESAALKLEKGMSAIVSSGGEENCEGKVDLISPQADNQSFNFIVRILLLRNDNAKLKPGMFATVVIPLEIPGEITVIPEKALVSKRENGAKVFTINNGIVSERNVILGRLLGGEREIISGLREGELAVLDPGPNIMEGVYVSAVE